MSEPRTGHHTREARLASLDAATGGALPAVLLELVDGYAAYCTFVLFHPLHAHVKAEGQPALRVVEEGPTFVFAHISAIPEECFEPCLAHIGGGNVLAVYKKDGGRNAPLGAKVCVIGGTGDAKTNMSLCAWTEVTPPPVTRESGTFCDYRLHALGGRPFLFESVDKHDRAAEKWTTSIRVLEYDLATDVWTEGAATRALPLARVPSRNVYVATATVLYSFTTTGPWYAFDLDTCTWSQTRFDTHGICLDYPPLALSNNGFLFLLTRNINGATISVARYLGDDANAVGGCVRWQRVVWTLPRPSDGYVHFMSWWAEPFDDRLYLALIHESHPQKPRVHAWSRSLRMTASKAAPLDCYMESSVAAWTHAWTREYEAKLEGDYLGPDELLSYLSTLSTAPPPLHTLEHVEQPPPTSMDA